MGFRPQPKLGDVLNKPDGFKVYRLTQRVIQTSTIIVLAPNPQTAETWARGQGDGGPNLLYVNREPTTTETMDCTELGSAQA